MKFLRVLLALTMLFCGFAGHAKADGIDFRATVLDGENDCTQDNTGCFIKDPTQTITIALSPDACPAAVMAPQGEYGCFVGDNLTGFTITALNITFTNAPYENQTPSCDSAGQNGIPSALDVISCQLEQDPNDPTKMIYQLNFGGGSGVADGSSFFFFEEGANPDDFTGTATITVAETPEPDSLVLLSTGTLMVGLFAFSQRRRLGFDAGRM
jgi:hypothetical protein